MKLLVGIRNVLTTAYWRLHMRTMDYPKYLNTLTLMLLMILVVPYSIHRVCNIVENKDSQEPKLTVLGVENSIYVIYFVFNREIGIHFW